MYLFLILFAIAFVIIIIVLYSHYRNKKKSDLALSRLYFSNNEANNSIEIFVLWSKFQNGTFKFAPKDIILTEEINNIVNQSKPLIESKRINLSTNTPQDILVYVDSTVLNLIFRYFTLYTVKCSTDGGSVRISATQTGEFIKSSFTYSEISKKADELSKLFDSNIQNIDLNIENKHSENLGLTLCKEFIENSGGKIWVDTLPDNRVNVNFTLPKKS